MNIKDIKREVVDALYEVSLFKDKDVEVSNFSESAKDLIENLEELLQIFEQSPKDLAWEMSIPLDNFGYYLEDLNKKYSSITLGDFLLRVDKIHKQLIRIKDIISKKTNIEDSKLIKDGDKLEFCKKAQQYANRLGKPVVYGYTSKRNPNKFYEIKMREYDGDDTSFRSRYSANTIYVAYPNAKKL